MKITLRKTLALLLCLCMCLSLVPAAFAEDDGIVWVDPLIEPETDDGIVALDEPEDIELIPDEVETPDEPVGDGVPDVPETPDETEAPDDSVGDGVPDVPQTPDLPDTPAGEEPTIPDDVRDDETFAASASGSIGGIAWSLNNAGKLTITGNGAITGFYEYETSAWRAYKNDIRSVVIGSGITSIGQNAFRDCIFLKSATIPDTVTTIGKWAFQRTVLSSVTIPNSVTTIDNCGFDGCGDLVTVNIGNSVTTIGDYAFRNCPLSSVTIPDSVTTIGKYAFDSCIKLERVTIPNSVTKISDAAFRGCSSLTSVTIPNSVTNIGTSAFSRCTSLTNVTIPNSVTTIGDWAFYECGLTSVTIPNSVTSFAGAFYNCSSLASVNISSGVTNIGASAFRGCSSLTSVNIPNSVTTIGDWAFSECGLTSVTIPNSVTTIGASAFRGCSSLTSVNIPNSVKRIERYTFDGCTALTDVYYGGSEADWKGVRINSGNDPLNNAAIHYNTAYTFSMSLNLAEAIGVNFYVGGAQSYDGLTIAWTKKDGTAVSMPVTSGTRRGDGSYVIPLETLAAREMTVPIPVTVKNANGAVLKQTTCSVKAYCDAVAANAQVGESLKDLCHAALVYGSAAQTRFSFRTDDLADPDYRASLPSSVPNNADTAAARSDPAGGITGYGVSLNLISQTEMNVYLVHEKGTKFSDYSFSVKKNGAKYTNITAVENGSYYVVTVKGISPKDLTTSYAVEAKNGSASFTVTLTPLAYSRINQNSTTDREIAKGVYLYGLAAKAYK